MSDIYDELAKCAAYCEAGSPAQISIELRLIVEATGKTMALAGEAWNAARARELIEAAKVV